MLDYKTMYMDLFNAITNAVEILCEAQKKTEENFINNFENKEEIEKVIPFKLTDLKKE